MKLATHYGYNPTSSYGVEIVILNASLGRKQTPTQRLLSAKSGRSDKLLLTV